MLCPDVLKAGLDVSHRDSGWLMSSQRGAFEDMRLCAPLLEEENGRGALNPFWNIC